MRKRFLRTSGVALACVTGLLLTTSPVAVAAATPASATITAGVDIPPGELAPESSPLHVLNPYVTYSGRGFTIDAPRAVLAQVSKPMLRQLLGYVAQLNDHIRAGHLTMTPAGFATSGAAAGRLAADGPHGYIKSHWYGIEVGLDAWLTNKVEGAAWTGSGVSTLAALLGGGPYAGAVAAALAILAGSVQVCQHQNGWTYLYWVGVPVGVGGVVCNPFG
ncbi:hypothetical protein [Streptomyces sp. NBC_01465]|uniref:hypothetical protein n=1 Tax=Streptomyces sp. NBC_01465 TaxID=2903878 RepID=UPI002E35C65D|nr:hypothetical protein [Streptomyces sp. NBC_01465]